MRIAWRRGSAFCLWPLLRVRLSFPSRAFRQIRLYILLFALLSAGVSGYALYSSYRFAEK